MKVVIDTNILVSAILKGRLPRTVIQFVIESNKIEWIVSEAILTEYKDVVSRPKFKLSEGVIREWYKVFDTVPRLIDVHSAVDFPRDRSDAKFLACVMASDADFLITGDQDFEEVDNLGSTTIISASEFKALVIDPVADEES
ncbi:MAG: putative toxin-antitoxin system toxin component, PIN family [Microcystis sp.]|jgi:putative PIN family toxin of toxin-antitoxin system|uniref:putative toxin-antitoxin system toxin component, PIN family n=1 Tax=Microcystis TaxID=1125 RepID=UPI0016802540|nr:MULTISPECIES: putative toxin-antitoxin system toxin component, PIN family [Microcystis]NCQ91553.1 putative toxin-antitoxin system toxin component, PIN family [Microcystis aeruginosa LG13-13]NCR04732.1 putative toxin-antitoxin system toxin component, PIN family [Microcystis aeruginosa LG13-03]NCR62995.1 putative toxin-antitoxin system toxin component, PIN family [Microcystis aeruginosa LG11-05]NCR73946.1 putative toxin-antitoxin system toxin component, PIN family [Microcystis aeruginosa LG13-